MLLNLSRPSQANVLSKYVVRAYGSIIDILAGHSLDTLSPQTCAIHLCLRLPVLADNESW
jgi:hypothetical protein